MAQEFTPRRNIAGILLATVIWGRMIKFQYSIFALPYAWLGAFLAARGLPPLNALIWLTIAMVGVRSFAMTLNRLADLDLDRLNPRTAKRALVTGDISLNAARVFAFGSALVYFGACVFIGRLALILSPIPIMVIIVYSWSKRWTWTSPFILGLAHAFAPAAGWISVDQHLTLPIALFSCAVLFWTAGFDMIYSTQDLDFDIACSLPSLPARSGVAVTLDLAACSHFVFIIFLFLAVWGNGLGWIGLLMWLLVVGAIILEHRLVKPDDLRRLNTAFFTLNAVIAISIFVGALLAIFLG